MIRFPSIKPSITSGVSGSSAEATICSISLSVPIIPVSTAAPTQISPSNMPISSPASISIPSMVAEVIRKVMLL